MFSHFVFHNLSFPSSCNVGSKIKITSEAREGNRTSEQSMKYTINLDKSSFRSKNKGD